MSLAERLAVTLDDEYFARTTFRAELTGGTSGAFLLWLLPNERSGTKAV